MPGQPALHAPSPAADRRAAAVSLVGLEKRFADFDAVKGVDLEVLHGEFFSLIGPSGCGKTTTLRMIAGLEEPTGGSILVGGRDMTAVPAYRRPVNTVFQHYALFPHLTVFENVAFGLRERRLKKGDVRDRVGEMLELVGLAGRDDARPKELSGGQQQRVALARSLVLEPEVLLLDEPLGALDLKMRKQMQGLLKRVQREVGITFVYVTHDQEEAFSMSDRVGIMNAGFLEHVGTPPEVYHRPRTMFVADFVGASNQLRATVLACPALSRVRVEVDGLGTIECDGADGLQEAAAAVAIVRPESIEIEPPDRDGTVKVVGTISDVSYLGPQIVYTVDVAVLGSLTVVVNSQTHAADSVGAERRFGWPAAAMWVVP